MPDWLLTQKEWTALQRRFDRTVDQLTDRIKLLEAEHRMKREIVGRLVAIEARLASMEQRQAEISPDPEEQLAARGVYRDLAAPGGS